MDNKTSHLKSIHIAQLQLPGDQSKFNISSPEAKYTYPSTNDSNIPIVPNIGQCVRVPSMGRYAVSNRAFQTKYQLRMGIIPVPNKITVPDYEPIVLRIDVETVFDTGGTLKYDIELEEESYVRNTYFNLKQTAIVWHLDVICIICPICLFFALTE